MKKSKFIQLVIVGAALASASCQRQQVYSSSNNINPNPALPPDSTNARADSTFYPADTLGVYQGYYPYYYQYPYNQFYLNIRPNWGFCGRHHRFHNAYYYGRGGYHNSHMHTASIAHSHGTTSHTSGHFGGNVSHGGFGYSGGHSFGGHS